jgi:hypothetical protein
VARPRRQPVTAEAFMQEVRLTSRRAAVAGSLLLTMLQLYHSGRRPSLNQAIPLVTALLPEWQQPQNPYWSKTWKNWKFLFPTHQCTHIVKNRGQAHIQVRPRSKAQAVGSLGDTSGASAVIGIDARSPVAVDLDRTSLSLGGLIPAKLSPLRFNPRSACRW